MDIESNELLSLAQAAKACPAVDGKRPHASTIWRWMRKGIGGVRLEHVRIGRRVVTTRPALDDFFRATAAASNPAPMPKPSAILPTKGRTPKQRERALNAARAELAGHGIRVNPNGEA